MAAPVLSNRAPDNPAADGGRTEVTDPLTELIRLPADEKERRGLLHTPAEIRGQMELWESTFTIFRAKLERIRAFLGGFLRAEKKHVICAGAGTSEYIGYCVEGLLRRRLQVPVDVVSTASLVTNPETVLLKKYDTLLVSFARSGNSPESLGAVLTADMVSDRVRHLVVTCNERGALAKWAERAQSRAAEADSETADAARAVGRGSVVRGAPVEERASEKVFALLLDGRTDDKGLAMTSSFTNMVVAGQLLAHAFDFAECGARLARTAEAAKNFLGPASEAARELGALDFERAVFLGSGPHWGTAIESRLKLQELTAGRVMCAFDTFMGLRHGPAALIDGRTLIVAYISKDPYRRGYEIDLLRELRGKKLGMRTVACGPALDDRTRSLVDVALDFDPGGASGIDDEHAPPVSVIFGQLLGLFKSLALGLMPDAPSRTGIINRVVKGVRVYNLLAHRASGTFEIIAGE